MPDMVKKTVKLTKDPAGAPAFDLDSLGESRIDLKKRADKVGISLSKAGLSGMRAQVVLLLDHSGSMNYDYHNGAVQALVERVLAFSLQVDADGEIPVIAFDSRLYPAVTVTVDNYQGVVDSQIWRRHEMGSTVMSAPLEALKAIAEKSDYPVFAVVIGDGSPNREDKRATKKVAYELAGYPVFIKFLSLRPVDFLQELDDATEKDRLLDNIDAKDIPDPQGIAELAFADLMVDEWQSWIDAATKHGVISS
ncbi:MAG: VWA domain-containing protein [Candidatus Nanopelagicales bacterium]